MATKTTSPLDLHLPWLVRLFTWYVRRYLARSFHAVRLAHAGADPDLPVGPLVVALTHPSWWDPLIAAALTEQLPGRLVVAPIDARALGRYRFFERLGFFGIEPGTPSGWARLLEVGRVVLQQDDTALWITPQGHFADARRPVVLRRGIGHLVHGMRGGAVLPVALEYTFWEERTPEALVKFGEPILVEDGSARQPDEWTEAIGTAMDRARLELAELGAQRDAGAFRTVVSGRSGIQWAYDLYSRARAWLRGEVHHAEHGALRTGRAS